MHGSLDKCTELHEIDKFACQLTSANHLS